MFPAALRVLTSDAWLLFVARFTRLFAYGSLSVILIFYLVSLGLSESQSGLVLTLTLAGDIAVIPGDTRRPDRSVTDARGGSRLDGAGRPCVCGHKQSDLPHHCGHDRRHQPQRP